MKFEFTNLDTVLNELDKKISDEALKKSVGQACAIVEREAKQKAPKDTGALRRSIHSTTKKEDGKIVGTVFSDAEYAPYRYVRSLNRAKSGKPKQLKLHWQSRGN